MLRHRALCRAPALLGLLAGGCPLRAGRCASPLRPARAPAWGIRARSERPRVHLSVARAECRRASGVPGRTRAPPRLAASPRAEARPEAGQQPLTWICISPCALPQAGCSERGAKPRSSGPARAPDSVQPARVLGASGHHVRAGNRARTRLTSGMTPRARLPRYTGPTKSPGAAIRGPVAVPPAIQWGSESHKPHTGTRHVCRPRRR